MSLPLWNLDYGEENQQETYEYQMLSSKKYEKNKAAK